jgi:hypothetical protein
MRAWIACVRALPVTFALYVIEACVAALAALPLASEFTRSAPVVEDATALAQWLERLLLLAAPARVGARGALLAFAALLLVSPGLHMTWLSALSRREYVMDSVTRGVRLWFRACLVSLWVAAGMLIFALPFVGAAWGVSRVLADQLNDRVHDLILVSALAPLACFAFFAHVWHDLARARALHEGAFASTRSSLRFALRPAVLSGALLWSGLGWSLLVAAQFAPSARLGAPLILVGLLQLAVLARLFLRSRWLTLALTCAEDGSESGAMGTYAEDRA